MIDRIQQTETEIREAIRNIHSQEELEAFRLQYLSRKGIITSFFEALKQVPVEQKREMGQRINALRDTTEALFAEKQTSLEAQRETIQSDFDPTLPGRKMPRGHQHIITKTIEEINAIFVKMGFDVAVGPELESDYYNFEALNFPPNHPARDMQDTFFVGEKVLLRTHTTPVQVRVMERQPPPVRIIMPGRVYRNEAISARSHVQFHQIDGVYVDEDVTFADLKGTLVAFAHQFYGSALKYRFRASFFPFTEPSAEMDITCYFCNGNGCRICKQTGWLEILGCGMVDPNVFHAVGIDAEKYTGYAFGMGIERIAMLRTGIDDIRLFFENDLRVIQQFN